MSNREEIGKEMIKNPAVRAYALAVLVLRLMPVATVLSCFWLDDWWKYLLAAIAIYPVLKAVADAIVETVLENQIKSDPNGTLATMLEEEAKGGNSGFKKRLMKAIEEQQKQQNK